MSSSGIGETVLAAIADQDATGIVSSIRAVIEENNIDNSSFDMLSAVDAVYNERVSLLEAQVATLSAEVSALVNGGTTGGGMTEYSATVSFSAPTNWGGYDNLLVNILSLRDTRGDGLYYETDGEVTNVYDVWTNRTYNQGSVAVRSRVTLTRSDGTPITFRSFPSGGLMVALPSPTNVWTSHSSDSKMGSLTWLSSSFLIPGVGYENGVNVPLLWAGTLSGGLPASVVLSVFIWIDVTFDNNSEALTFVTAASSFGYNANMFSNLKSYISTWASFWPYPGWFGTPIFSLFDNRTHLSYTARSLVYSENPLVPKFGSLTSWFKTALEAITSDNDSPVLSQIQSVVSVFSSFTDPASLSDAASKIPIFAKYASQIGAIYEYLPYLMEFFSLVI